MANNLVFQLKNETDVNALTDHVAKRLQMQGYQVRVYPAGEGIITLAIEKDTGGIYPVLGYCQSLKATFVWRDGSLTVYFADEAWIDKVIGFIVGWFFCGIPWVFTGIGLYNQIQLPKKIENEIIMFTGIGPAPFGAPGFYTPPFGTPPFHTEASNQAKKCEGCGNLINTSSVFCKHCGKKQ